MKILLPFMAFEWYMVLKSCETSIKQKKIHPGSPVRRFVDIMRADPKILGAPKRVKFEDSCGQKSSLGISNDLKLGQVLHTDNTKILAKSCPDLTS